MHKKIYHGIFMDIKKILNFAFQFAECFDAWMMMAQNHLIFKSFKPECRIQVNDFFFFGYIKINFIYSYIKI